MDIRGYSTSEKLSGDYREVTLTALTGNKNAMDVIAYPAPQSVNEALFGDGVNDHALIGNVAQLNFTNLNPFTVFCFFRTSDSGTNVMFSKQGAANALGWRLELVGGQIRWHLSGGAAGNRLDVRSTLSIYADNKWHFIAVTYTGSSNATGVEMFIDGVQDVGPVINTNNLVSTSASATDAQISGRNGTTTPFPGRLDDVGCFNIALTPANAALLLDGFGPGATMADITTHPNLANLVCYYPIDGTIYPNILDQGPNSLHALMVNYAGQDNIIQVVTEVGA